MSGFGSSVPDLSAVVPPLQLMCEEGGEEREGELEGERKSVSPERGVPRGIGVDEPVVR